jgi:hypothetical protein
MSGTRCAPRDRTARKRFGGMQIEQFRVNETDPGKLEKNGAFNKKMSLKKPSLE